MEGVANIKFTDFEKIDMRVAEIQNIEDIEGTDNLYKLTISIGKELRTIVAAIKKFYSHDDLKGKKIIVLTNLEPKKIRGIESKGMLLAAVSEDESRVSLIVPEKDAKVGDKVR